MADLDLTALPERLDVGADGARLAVEVGGDGAPVLCLHAGVADRRSWRPVAPWLATDHRLVAYDRRGYGDTTYRPEAHDELADLLAVMDATHIDRAVLVGNSQGGRVAIEAALAHPDRVAGLVLAAPAWTGAPWDEAPEWFTALEDQLEAAEIAHDLDEVNRLEALMWLDGPAGPEGRVGGAARELFLDMNARALAAEPVGPRADHGAVWSDLGTVTVPVTVVQGDLDVPSSVALASVGADRLPDARLEVLAGVAHLPSLEVPERFAELVAELVDRTR